jgi:hypothetical protein
MEKCRNHIVLTNRGKLLLLVLFGILIYSVFGSEAVANGALDLSLRSVKDSYVLKEPVKFTAVLTNVSNTEARIMEVGELTPNMEYMYFEIEYPSGRVDCRRFRFMEVEMIPNPEYTGEPLPPGQSVYIILYPNVSEVIRSSSVEQSGGQTFNEAGTYKVRLVYSIPKVWDNLSPNRVVVSNSIEINFREADQIESEILDACWVGGGGWFSVGEGCPGSFPEEYESNLRDVIERYPDHPMNDYTRLLLASALISFTLEAHAQRIAEGFEVLDELDRLVGKIDGDRDVSFRSTERAMLRGYGLCSLGKKEESMIAYRNALQKKPQLRTNSYFMWGFLECEYDTPEPVSKWWRNRRNGVPNPDRNIDLISD